MDQPNDSVFNIFHSLEDNNEKELIERAAAYIAADLKEDDFFKLDKNLKKYFVRQVIGEENPNFTEIYRMFAKMLPIHSCDDNTLGYINKTGIICSRKLLALRQSCNTKLVKLLTEILGSKYTYINHHNINQIIRYTIVDFAITNFNSNFNINFHNCEPNKSQLEDLKHCREIILSEPNFPKDIPEIAEIKNIITYFLSLPETGKRNDVDCLLGTHKFVFASLGFHNTGAYGNNHLILNKSLLSDSSITTPVAATCFHRNLYGQSIGRIWIKEKGCWPQCKEDFDKSKIKNSHLGILPLVSSLDFLGRLIAYHRHGAPKQYQDAALMFFERLGTPNPCISHIDITKDDIRNYIIIADQLSKSHHVFEVHIPNFTSEKIDMIIKYNNNHDLENLADKIIIAENAQNLWPLVESYSAPR